MLTTDATFNSLGDAERHQKLLETLHRRGVTRCGQASFRDTRLLRVHLRRLHAKPQGDLQAQPSRRHDVVQHMTTVLRQKLPAPSAGEKLKNALAPAGDPRAGVELVDVGGCGSAKETELRAIQQDQVKAVEVYQGPTGRRVLKETTTATVAVSSGSDQTLPGPM